MTQNQTLSFQFSMPRIVSVADFEAGKERLREVMEAIAPARQAISQAENEILLVGVCDLIEGAKGLGGVNVSGEMESDDEGGGYVSLSVSCEYEPTDEEEGESNIEDELHDLLSEVGEEIYQSDLCDEGMPPKDFIKRLAELLIGAEPAMSWFAERERLVIESGVQKASKSSGPSAL